MILDPSFLNPPTEFSLIPFWFWNDDLSEAELLRQIDDMEAHGVYGFVIHPRVGLPRSIGWMSERMLHFVRFAVDEAARRGMQVVLYDEGMYPSGSSSGQVVAENLLYRCRCLAKVDLESDQAPALQPGWNLVAIATRANEQRVAVIDRPVDAFIRGLHYIGEGPKEDEPPAADILNPDAVAAFVRLVYDRYFEALRDHFGKTVFAMFTDEPGVLGRCRERGVWPGTTGILEHVNAYLGYDFTPHLPALWYEDETDAVRYRRDYERAIAQRLEETYYTQLSNWCTAHGIALTGHPAAGDEIGLERHFHIPGQDIVWRWVLPNHPSALEGRESTQGKCSSSAMLHLGRRRNSNECFGAFGHQFTWEEMKWLVDWCFVRGVNLLYPHAFFYSVRGPRRDERPPDVGPHAPWWDDYKPFADYCRRMCWLNTDSVHQCEVAILGQANFLPWRAAKICFQRQCDFNYLEMRHLWEDAQVSEDGIRIAGMHYKALIVDGVGHIPVEAMPALGALARARRLIVYGEDEWSFDGAQIVDSPDALVAQIDRLVPPDLTVEPPQPDLRCRHVIKDGLHYYMLCNEGREPLRFRLQVAAQGEMLWVDPFTLEQTVQEPELVLEPCTIKLLRIG
ncbi:MAG: hypothetical protein JW934_18980 [Anaerolineae bacterium]|nr:hypothetical protein [Anaerolineae bacterium]